MQSHYSLCDIFYIWIFIPILGMSCSSAPKIHTQSYAKLKTYRIYEYEFPIVWKAIEEVFQDYKILEKKPQNPLKIKNSTQASLKTDWVYTQSRDHYIEYLVNFIPQKIYLPTRFQYILAAKQGWGGTNVYIQVYEEINKLNTDGSSNGYENITPDSSRASELLDKINLAILKSYKN